MQSVKCNVQNGMIDGQFALFVFNQAEEKRIALEKTIAQVPCYTLIITITGTK
jgi:hypothetical protein